MHNSSANYNLFEENIVFWFYIDIHQVDRIYVTIYCTAPERYVSCQYLLSVALIAALF